MVHVVAASPPGLLLCMYARWSLAALRLCIQLPCVASWRVWQVGARCAVTPAPSCSRHRLASRLALMLCACPMLCAHSLFCASASVTGL